VGAHWIPGAHVVVGGMYLEILLVHRASDLSQTAFKIRFADDNLMVVEDGSTPIIALLSIIFSFPFDSNANTLSAFRKLAVLRNV